MNTTDNRRTSRLAFSICASILSISATSAFGVPITVPPGLNPGDQYRLAFVTSTTGFATSSNISTYNAFVTNVANGVAELAALGTTWTAIGSTASVDARDNTGTNPSSTGVPIYRLDGAWVAENNANLWDGFIGNLIKTTETGSLKSALVFTGTAPNGTKYSGSYLGGGNKIMLGHTNLSNNSDWIATGIMDYGFVAYSLYGISGVLTVVPEPSAFILFCAGTFSLALRRRRR
jgi:hypothetical protein